MDTRFRCRARSRGVTLLELLVAATVMGIVSCATSLIYFSVLSIYNQRIWALPPYDEATAAVQRLQKEMRQAMLIHDHADDALVAIDPLTDANHENVLQSLGNGGYALVQGDMVAFYLSDATGSTAATGNTLWKAVKEPGAAAFTPRVKIAENIHPELNPTDPNTGQPRPMFDYWPDDTHLWGVEVWVTSTSTVHGQLRTQTAHSQIYLRNL
jgi:prepilin-type N-terminal cleavage/methylation domain-containing protein